MRMRRYFSPTLSFDTLPFRFGGTFGLSRRSITTQHIPHFNGRPPTIPTSVLFSLTTTCTFVMNFTLQHRPFPTPTVSPIPTMLIRMTTRLHLTTKEIFQYLHRQPCSLPIQLRKLLHNTWPTRRVVSCQRLVPRRRTCPYLIREGTLGHPLQSSIFSLSKLLLPKEQFLLQLPPSFLLFRSITIR